MSARSLLATYFQQQKQISMPDLVLSNADSLDCLRKVSKVAAKAPAKAPVQQSNSDLTIRDEPRPVSSTVSPPSNNKLAFVRKVDKLTVTPRVKKVAMTPVGKAVKGEQSGPKREQMIELFKKGCEICHLSKSRIKMVFGSGTVDAQIMIIGEAPGAEEDKQGLPFVGAAGQLLTQMLAAIQIDRTKDTFITNILKCHPPSNRNPESTEIQTCLPLLKEQIAIIQPKAILLLGHIAAHALLGVADSIANMRSKVLDYEGIPCMVINHPAELLRNPEYKRPAWEDLQKFKELLVKSGIHGSL